ncbi:MAG: hypothetical protein NZ842_15535, partial [Dehalococcoidia bacterium]|nr:hypothetical protein [Dehalococcoidia bacterium]
MVFLGTFIEGMPGQGNTFKAAFVGPEVHQREQVFQLHVIYGILIKKAVLKNFGQCRSMTHRFSQDFL